MTVQSENMYGLILAGGHSKRMGQDKALLAYHGQPQVLHVHDLLMPLCAQVFVSIRPDQAQQYSHLAQLPDALGFGGIGPLGGICSAMAAHPGKAWLILACDLPFINTEALMYLINRRNPQKFATAFISTQDRMPEPLCAIWEPQSQVKILNFLKEGIQCPRKILMKSDTHLIEQKDPRWLNNINSPQEYAQLLRDKNL